MLLVLLISVSLASLPSQEGYIANGGDLQSQFFYRLHPSENASAPLIMWLQGGPGGSSLFGDFLENGPRDVYGQPRPTSWTQVASMLYCDNPIGTGFSYTNNGNFATTDLEIANGLVNFLSGFLARWPQYVQTPLWVFCESYGGKMTAVFGMQLQKAILAGQIKANFQGVTLGDGWLAPLDCMVSYAPFLQAMSLIDHEQAVVVQQFADDAAIALNRDNNGAKATDLWGQQQNYIGNACDNCNWYNSINSTDLDAAEAQLNVICSPGGSFYQKVQNIVPSNVSFGGQANQVFSELSDAFMRSGVYAVEYLLTQPLKVNVVSGQLDIIVDALCTEMWINNMTWSGLPQFKAAPEQFINIAGVPQGIWRSFTNFAFYKIFRAGHMVPNDNPQAALWMVKNVIFGK